jgi:hypothetical protein
MKVCKNCGGIILEEGQIPIYELCNCAHNHDINRPSAPNN